MKVFYLFDKGFNISYLEPFIEKVDAKKVNIKDVKLSDLRSCDVLIYQTFPDESHPVKFDANVVEATDDIFRGFRGVKLLFDAHDEGAEDAYTRFADMEPFPLVIKLFMEEDYPHGDFVAYRPDIEPVADFIDWLEEEVKASKPKITVRKKRTYTRKTTSKKSTEKSEEEKDEE